MHARPMAILLAAILLPAIGAEQPATVVESIASALPDEERWSFEPRPREEIFIDPEQKLQLERRIEDRKPTASIEGPKSGGGKPLSPDKVLEWAQAELQHIEEYTVAKRWDEAIRAADQAIAMLAKFQEHEPVRKAIEQIERAKGIAEEARIYEQAQARFDALELKVEGILWSAEGALALINGEPRARAVNDRVKDCVIINIDTNRVDFLFHYERRRFEFQRYVGEDGRGRKAAER